MANLTAPKFRIAPPSRRSGTDPRATLVGRLTPVIQAPLWSRSRRSLAEQCVSVFMVILIASACSNISASAGMPNGPQASALQPSAQVPPLVAAPNLLTTECAAAALRLGYPVPCPQIVPSLSGEGMPCPQPVGAATAVPCVGLEGSPPYSVFFLEFTGFAVPPDYIGVDGKPDGHVTLEARPTADSPPKPCIGGTFLGTVKVGIWKTKEYVCPNDSLRVEREARNGEGVYVGHLALEWQVKGTQYIISAHGHTTANLALLRRLGGSIELTAPS